MDGWVEGGWMDGWMDEWMDEWMDGFFHTAVMDVDGKEILQHPRQEFCLGYNIFYIPNV
jgi:hypothetical protein